MVTCKDTERYGFLVTCMIATTRDQPEKYSRYMEQDCNRTVLSRYNPTYKARFQHLQRIAGALSKGHPHVNSLFGFAASNSGGHQSVYTNMYTKDYKIKLLLAYLHCKGHLTINEL